MIKRRSPKEIIESVDKPGLEETWVKLPRQEPKSISILRRGGWVRSRSEKDRYTIHTHPDPYQREPSPRDFTKFLSLNDRKTMVVAQTNPENGKLIGYFILRKTKKTPQIDSRYAFFDKMLNLVTSGLYEGKTIGTELRNLRRYSGEEYPEKFRELMIKYNLKYKYFRVKDTLGGGPKETKKSLEGKLAMIVSISGFILSAFFLSTNLTGNAIADLSTKTTSFLVAGSIIIGLVAGFFWFRSCKHLNSKLKKRLKKK